MGKGKGYNIYLNDEDSELVAKYRQQGLTMAEAVKRVLVDKDKVLFEKLDYVIKGVDIIRAAPILQIGYETPMVTVTNVPGKESKKKGFWHRLLKQ